MNIFKRFRKASNKQIDIKKPGIETGADRAMPANDSPRPLLDAGPAKTLRAHDMLVQAQPALPGFYLIISGFVELSLSTQEATSQVVLQKGDVVGSLSQHDPHTSYALKSLSTSAVVHIDEKSFPHLPDAKKIFLYNESHKTLSKILAEHARYVSMYKNRQTHLASYIANFEAGRKGAIDAKIIQDAIDHIPKLPTYAGDLLLSCFDDNVSITQITEKIQKDPSLAGLILKNVNSSYYGLRRKISSLHHAIAYLGMNNVYQVILGDAIKHILPNSDALKDIQIHSNLISIMAHEISDLCKKTRATNPITIGILHDIGKIVVLLLKRKFPHISDLINTLDDTVLGARLLQKWDLPDSIFCVVESQNLPQFCPPESLDEQYRDDIIVLYLAHVYYDMLTEQHQYSLAYIDQYVGALKSPFKNYQQLYQEGIVPALRRNKQRFPESISQMLTDKLRAD